MQLSKLTIRDASIKDGPLLARAERAIAETPGFLASQPFELIDEQFEKKISELTKSDNGKYLVAEIDKEIVGHGMLNPLPLFACRHVVQLTLAVHLDWQGKGIGKALLGELIKWAKSSTPIEKIELNVRSSNKVAHELYKKVGFTETGRWKRRLKVEPGNYIDDVCMELWVT
jgi:RimJ/RimL family protein N-acetyltransferase